MAGSLRLALLSLTACLGSIYIGFSLSQFDILFDYMNTHFWNLTDQFDIKLYRTLLGCLIPIGALLGAIVANFISRSTGRQTCLIITDVLGILFGVTSQFSGLYVQLAARLL
jgi:hypothetical protein